jgi:agmatine deiminase
MAFTADLVKTLLPIVAIKLLVPSVEAQARAIGFLRTQGVATERLRTFVHADAPFFVRDPVQFMVNADGKAAVVDLGWNTYGMAEWCDRYRFPGEPERARACRDYAQMDQGKLDRWVGEQLGTAPHSVPVVMEAGGIELNGDGLLLVSEPLALQRNRNLTRAQLEAGFRDIPGVRKVVWLGEGLVEDLHIKGTITGDYVGIGTGGHTDEFVRFADTNTVLLAWVTEEEAERHPLNAMNRDRMIANHAILSRSTDAHGRRIRIIKVPLPEVVERQEVLAEKSADPLGFSVSSFPASEGRKIGDRIKRIAAASYLNYLVVNGHLVVPTYAEDGTSETKERHVAAIFRKAFPGKSLHWVRATDVNWGGGGIHCATNSEPS